jgi:hypothetical protein
MTTRTTNERDGPLTTADTPSTAFPADEEDSIGRGMLSAYVVSSETGPPRAGFFELATKLGRTFDDRLAFWVEEMKRVGDAWRNPR